MADVVSGIGSGRAFSGVAKDYEGLIGRGLSIRASERARKEKEFADEFEFDLKKASELYPYYSNQYIQKTKEFVNEYKQNRDIYGADRAQQMAVMKKPQVYGELLAITQNNSEAKNHLEAPTKGLIGYGTQDLGRLVMNKDTPDNEWSKLNMPGYGVYAGAQGTFKGTQYKQEDLDKMFTSGGYQRLPVGLPEKIGIPGMGTTKQLRQQLNYSPNDIANYASRIKENPDALRTFVLSNEQEFKQKLPDIFSDDEVKRNQAVDIALLDFASKRMTPDVTVGYHNVGTAGQGTATERQAKQTSIEYDIPQQYVTEGGGKSTNVLMRASLQSRREKAQLANTGRIINPNTGENISKDLPAQFEVKAPYMDLIPVAHTDKNGKKTYSNEERILATALVYDPKAYKDVELEVWNKRFEANKNLIPAKEGEADDVWAARVRSESKPSKDEVESAMEASGRKTEITVSVPYEGNKGQFTNFQQVDKAIDDYYKQNPNAKKTTGVKSNTGGGNETKKFPLPEGKAYRGKKNNVWYVWDENIGKYVKE